MSSPLSDFATASRRLPFAVALSVLTVAAASCSQVAATPEKAASASSADSLLRASPLYVDTMLAGHTVSKCLDVPSADSHNFQTIQTWDCNGYGQQNWTYDGTTIRDFAGRCISLPYGDPRLGQVHLWDCYDGDIAQQWLFDQSTMQYRWAGDTSLCLSAPVLGVDGVPNEVGLVPCFTPDTNDYFPVQVFATNPPGQEVGGNGFISMKDFEHWLGPPWRIHCDLTVDTPQLFSVVGKAGYVFARANVVCEGPFPVTISGDIKLRKLAPGAPTITGAVVGVTIGGGTTPPIPCTGRQSFYAQAEVRLTPPSDYDPPTGILLVKSKPVTLNCDELVGENGPPGARPIEVAATGDECGFARRCGDGSFCRAEPGTYSTSFAPKCGGPNPPPRCDTSTCATTCADSCGNTEPCDSASCAGQGCNGNAVTGQCTQGTCKWSGGCTSCFMPPGGCIDSCGNYAENGSGCWDDISKIGGYCWYGGCELGSPG